MTDVREAAQNLIEYAIHRSMIGQDDRIWAYNTILECIGATGPALNMTWALQNEKLSLLHPDTLPDFDLEGTLAALSEVAVASGAAEDTASGRDRIAMRIMGALMPRPSVVNEEFNGRMGVNEPRAATDWFYGLCCDAGYVRRAAIARNIKWSTSTNWGDLEITINLSKPEKDPRDIAAAGVAKNTGEKYPACQLCIENEGYPGRSAAADGGAHPARQNLRVIPIQLDGERWGFQYSPYAYFNEHCIAMSSEHRPMHVDRKSLSCLLDFVDLFPHYFIGSNADLPIVGGSILSHDHFQGGAHEFPMMHAAEVLQFSVPGFDQVSGTVLQSTPDFTIVKIRDGVEAELPHFDQRRYENERNERPMGERYLHNQHIKAVIIDVRDPNSNLQPVRGEHSRPPIVISRTHPELMRRLFEQEVPEIYEGTVQIKSIAREPGQRSKVAVHSLDDRLDPVGACVGPKGSRVRAVVGKLRGERVDVILWDADPAVYVANALSPAKVTCVLIDEEKAYAGVIVPDDQLSLAIGKEGQNARLAARLTGWHIDIKSETLAADILKNVPVHEEPAADLIGDEEDDDVRRCEYVSEDGIQCRNQARPGSRFCGVHDTDAFDDAEDLI